MGMINRSCFDDAVCLQIGIGINPKTLVQSDTQTKPQTKLSQKTPTQMKPVWQVWFPLSHGRGGGMTWEGF